MRPKGMKDLAAFSAREVKKAAAQKRKRRVFLCRRTVRVKVEGKVTPASFLKIQGRGMLIGAKDWKKEGRIEELVCDQNPPPRSRKELEKRQQRKCQEKSDCQKSDGEE